MNAQNYAEELCDFSPERDEFLQDVVTGLDRAQKELPSKYFYDERGSKLFDRICDVKEYYPTRTELAIMRTHIAEIATTLGPDCLLVEYGSGSSLKTRILLDHAERLAGYAPLDISKEHLADSSDALAAEYPDLPIYPVCADFTGEYELPEVARTAARRVVYFPGSTIGNFSQAAAAKFLAHIARICGASGGALIGIDMQKPIPVLEAAYNDAEGVTAAFNLNLLTRINRELNADFRLDCFAHKAFYNHEAARIEMHIESLVEQSVSIGGNEVAFAAGETIRTEYSHKYTIDGFAQLAKKGGMRVEQVWSDAEKMFSVVYLTVASS